MELPLRELLAKAWSYVVPDLRVRFRNRARELEEILTRFPPGHINIVFGPRGCGKTELARVLLRLSNEELYVVYVGYREEETARKYELVLPEVDLPKSLLEELRDYVEAVCEIAGLPRVIIRSLVSIYRFAKYFLSNLRLRHRQYIVVVDEFRRGQPIDEIRQSLEVEANTVRELNALISQESNGASCLKVIYFSSDASAQELQLRLGSKCRWWLMWYLPRNDFVAILEELRCPHSPDLIWHLTGGNLREVAHIHELGWDLSTWLEEKCSVVRQVIVKYLRSTGEDVEKLLDTLGKVVDEVDKLQLCRVWDWLVEQNLVIHVDARFTKISEISPTYWIGRDAAYQQPVYYWILKTITEQRRLDVSAEHVLKLIRDHLGYTF